MILRDELGSYALLFFDSITYPNEHQLDTALEKVYSSRLNRLQQRGEHLLQNCEHHLKGESVKGLRAILEKLNREIDRRDKIKEDDRARQINELKVHLEFIQTRIKVGDLVTLRRAQLDLLPTGLRNLETYPFAGSTALRDRRLEVAGWNPETQEVLLCPGRQWLGRSKHNMKRQCFKVVLSVPLQALDNVVLENDVEVSLWTVEHPRPADDRIIGYDPHKW